MKNYQLTPQDSNICEVEFLELENEEQSFVISDLEVAQMKKYNLTVLISKDQVFGNNQSLIDLKTKVHIDELLQNFPDLNLIFTNDINQNINSFNHYLPNDVIYFAIRTPIENLWNIRENFEKNMKLNLFGNSLTVQKIARDKNYILQLASKFDVRTTPSILIYKEEEPSLIKQKIPNDWSFPLFIKPNTGSLSKDAYIIERDEELYEKLKKISSTEILIQPFLSGREFTVVIVGRNELNNVEALPILEVIFPHEDNLFYSSKSKEIGETLNMTRFKEAKLDKETYNYMKDKSIELFRKFNCQDLVRIDWRMDSNGHPHFLELNCNGLLTPYVAGHRAYTILTNNENYKDFVDYVVDKTF